jgi:ApaG protein
MQEEKDHIYSETTQSIRVRVKPIYLDEQSSPSEDHYVWAYQVDITNLGAKTVQLLNRHWKITDSLGRMQEVRGPGVVGEQPTLKPGESFEYTSGTPLSTPSGFMMGTYEMQGETGELFEVTIPAFSLDSPYQPVNLN